jgi:hypothetical protein
MKFVEVLRTALKGSLLPRPDFYTIARRGALAEAAGTRNPSNSHCARSSINLWRTTPLTAEIGPRVMISVSGSVDLRRREAVGPLFRNQPHAYVEREI